MPTHFHEELALLKRKVLEMSAYAERSVGRAIQAFQERDAEMADRVVEQDATINRLDCEIDAFCLRLLALDQPMAVDLRFIVGSMRFASHLERVGDQAAGIAKRAIQLAQRPPLPLNPKFETVGALATEMLKNAVTAYNHNDVSMARNVCALDSRVNDLCGIILREQIDSMINETPAIERGALVILAARNFERLGDYASNMAENAIFIIEGVNRKHACEETGR